MYTAIRRGCKFYEADGGCSIPERGICYTCASKRLQPERKETMLRHGKGWIRLPSLNLLTMIYLALPWIVFAAGWCRWHAALVLLTALAAGIRAIEKEMAEQPPRLADARFTGRILLIALVLALAWTALSGAGGFGYQADHWRMYNALFRDLTLSNWPVQYSGSDGTEMALSAPIGWYLPAAAAGAAGGWQAAGYLLYLWTAAGVFLALLWVVRLTRAASVTAMIFFILSGPLSILGLLLYTGTTGIQTWSMPFSAEGAARSLTLYPAQCLAAWLGMALLMYQGIHRRYGAGGFFIVALTALWAPVTALGLLPFALLALAGNPHFSRRSAAALLSAILIGLAALLYYAGHYQSVRDGFLFTLYSADEILPKYALFLLLSFGLYLLFLSNRLPSGLHTRAHRVWMYGAAVVLFLLPVYVSGRLDDYCQAAGMPALFLIFILFAGWFIRGRWFTDSGARILLALAILMAAGNGAVLVQQARLFEVKVPRVIHFGETAGPGVLRAFRVAQALARPDTFFYRHLAGKGSLIEVNRDLAALPELDYSGAQAGFSLDTMVAGDLHVGERLEVGGKLRLRAAGLTNPDEGIEIWHNASAVNDYGLLVKSRDHKMLEITPEGKAILPRNLDIRGGVLNIGDAGRQAGVLNLSGGKPGQPGFLVLHSPSGKPWYLFIRDNGGLSIRGASPLLPASANGDSADAEAGTGNAAAQPVQTPPAPANGNGGGQ
jgi:hypothetical protein